MPAFDGTGPLGRGPGTGWGRGPCGAGLARGRSYNGRFWPRQEYSSDNGKEPLEEEIQELKKEMNEIKNYLKDLKKKK
jgi:hypothetical protein